MKKEAIDVGVWTRLGVVEVGAGVLCGSSQGFTANLGYYFKPFYARAHWNWLKSGDLQTGVALGIPWQTQRLGLEPSISWTWREGALSQPVFGLRLTGVLP